MLEFRPSPQMTLGVELELQLVDAGTKDLTPLAPLILERTAGNPKIKPEVFRAMLEVNSSPCTSVAELRADLAGTLVRLQQVCAEFGVEVASAGSHPFARHVGRVLYPGERYEHLLDRHRWLLRRLMVFGVHVHIGVRDGDHAAAMINAVLHYLPHLLALSASSPFWHGGDTGLASSRITIFEALPTAGHPCTFADWDEFVRAYTAMVRSGAIGSIKDIWWDVRPHPDLGTVELRICDALPTLTETLGLVALVQCLFAWLDARYQEGTAFPPPPYWILRENKWRASRWGLEAEIVLNDSGATRLLRDALQEVTETVEPFALALGCADELGTARAVMRSGPSYERQRRVFAATNSLQAVTESLIGEFRTDLAEWSAQG